MQQKELFDESTFHDRLFGEISTRTEQNVFGTDNEFIKALLAVQQTTAWHQQPNVLATQKITQHITKLNTN